MSEDIFDEVLKEFEQEIDQKEEPIKVEIEPVENEDETENKFKKHDEILAKANIIKKQVEELRSLLAHVK